MPPLPLEDQPGGQHERVCIRSEIYHLTTEALDTARFEIVATSVTLETREPYLANQVVLYDHPKSISRKGNLPLEQFLQRSDGTMARLFDSVIFQDDRRNLLMEHDRKFHILF